MSNYLDELLAKNKVYAESKRPVKVEKKKKVREPRASFVAPAIVNWLDFDLKVVGLDDD